MTGCPCDGRCACHTGGAYRPACDEPGGCGSPPAPAASARPARARPTSADRARELEHERAHVAIASAELAAMWPRLAAALDRDAGAGDSTGRAGTADPRRAIVNQDVQAAIQHIAVQAAGEIHTAMRALWRRGLPWPEPDLDRFLADVARWHEGLTDHGSPHEATGLAGQLFGWQLLARTALRLTTAARPLGARCPYHRNRPAVLMVDGDQAQLHTAVLAGRPVPAGEAPLSWRRGDTVFCPHPACGREWSGVVRLRLLSRLLDQLDRAEQAKATADAGDAR